MANSWAWEAAGWTEFGQPEDVYWYEPGDKDRERAAEEPDNPFASLPSDLDPSDVSGVWVHAYNLDDPDDETYFWVRSYMRLEEWEKWIDVIAITMDMHNMALA